MGDLGKGLEMAEEQSFYSDAGVLVTNTRFSYGGQTYAMANVTSVKAVRDGIGWAIIMLIAGFVFFIAQIWALAVIFVLVGGLLIYFRKTYLVLHTAGGEQRALSSTNAMFIGRVVVAVQEAIIHRG